MNRLITVVCRHNQARSVMAAAALGRYFPELEVASAGIAGVEGQRIPQSILNLVDAWGLKTVDLVSHSLEAVHERLLASDFVVVAEDDFISNIVQRGISPQRILSMQDQRFNRALIPFDPIGQGDQVLSVELAKAIMTTMQLLRAEGAFGYENPVNAIFTIDGTDLLGKLELAWVKATETKGIVLVTDFRAPNIHSVFRVCSNVLELRVGRIDQKIRFSDGVADWDFQQIMSFRGPIAISTRFEMDQTEKFVLSDQFIGLIARLAAGHPVSILTEPHGLGPCAFLTAANANI